MQRWGAAECNDGPLTKEKGTSDVNVMEADSFWVNPSKRFLEHFAKGNEFNKSRSLTWTDVVVLLLFPYLRYGPFLGKSKNFKNKYKMQRKTSFRKG